MEIHLDSLVMLVSHLNGKAIFKEGVQDATIPSLPNYIQKH